MLRVFVIEGKNLVAADAGNKSDPYVKLYSRANGNLYRFGRTETINSTLNPVWDKNAEKPIYCPSLRAESIFFELWDHDTMSGDDELGTCELKIDPSTQGRVQQLKVINKENKESYLFVKVMIPIVFFPKNEISKKIHALYVSLLYRPIIAPTEFPPISIQMLQLQNGKASLVLSQSKAIKFSQTQPNFLGPGGFTQVFRFNLVKSEGTFLPIVVLGSQFDGKVALLISGGLKEPKKGDIRRCDGDDQNILFTLDQNDVTVKEPGMYNSGVILTLKPKALPVIKKIASEVIPATQSLDEYASGPLKAKISF